MEAFDILLPDEIEISSLNDQQLADFRNRHLGFVWQTPSLLPEFSALENVMMPLLIRGVPPDAASGKARDRLAEVGLSGPDVAPCWRIVRRRTAARGFGPGAGGNPKVLLADEPTGSLDFRTGESIFALLNRGARRTTR